MIWASYIRVSSDKQSGDDRFGFARQRREILTYLKPFETPEPLEFKDIISGTKESRDDFEKLLQAAKLRRITKVCISEYDRLGRNLFTSFALMGEMVRAGLEVHSALDGKFDPNDSKSRRDFASRSSEADSELERIVRRMYSGLLEKARSGKPIRPLDCYGWNNGAVQEHEKTILEWIARESLTRGLHGIAAELNARGEPPPARGKQWHHTSIRHMLKNPVYVGQYQWGRKLERVVVPVEPLLDTELWHSVQRAIKARRSNSRVGNRPDFELQGRIFCSCGSVMSGMEHSSKKRIYYYCRARKAYKSDCENKTYYRGNDLHDAVKESLCELLASPESLEKSLIPLEVTPDNSIERKRLTERLARAKAAYLNGVDSLEEYSAEKNKLETALHVLEIEPTPQPPRDIKKMHTVLLEVFNSNNSLREVVKAFLLTVRVAPGGLVTLEMGA
jgi:site-specific DNA recombinase